MQCNCLAQAPEGLMVKTISSSLADPWGGTIPVGVEGIFDHFSLTLYGYIPLKYRLDGGLMITEKAHLEKDMKFKAEIRSYLNVRDETDVNVFLGIEFAYRQQQYHVYEPSYYHGDADVKFNSADVTKGKTAVGMYWGARQKISGSFYFEGYIGAGIKTYSIYRYNVEETSRSYYYSSLYTPQSGETHRGNGQHSGLYFPFGLSFSYHIK